MHIAPACLWAAAVSSLPFLFLPLFFVYMFSLSALFPFAFSAAQAATPSEHNLHEATQGPEASATAPIAYGYGYEQSYSGHAGYEEQHTGGHTDYGYPTADVAEALQQQLGVRDPSVCIIVSIY